MRRRWPVPCLILLLATTIGDAAPRQKPRELKIGETFESPLGNFALPIAPLGFGARAQHEGDATSGAISIHNDFGALRRLNYVRLTAPSPADLPSEERERYYREVLDDFLAANRGRLLHSEPIAIDGADMLYAFAFLPESSPLVDTRTSKHMDANRGLLIFTRDSFLYFAMTQMPITAMVRIRSSTTELSATEQAAITEEAKKSRGILESFYKTIAFR